MIFIAAELFFLRRDDHRRAKAAGILGIVAAVSAHSNLGAVFGLSHARPYWYGPLLPIYFIASALLFFVPTAISGAVRADYFWGWGDDAEAQAGRMKQVLRMWVLWPR